MNTSIILNSLIVVVLYFIISIFALDLRIPYPKLLIVKFHEPYIKILVYMCVYLSSYYNPIISLLCLILVVLLHSNDISVLK